MSVVDFEDYKKRHALREALELLGLLAESPIEWRFRRAASEFMKEHGLTAPDLLHIFRTAYQFGDFAGSQTVSVTGMSTDEEVFTLAIAFSNEPVCLRVLKGWKGPLRALKSA